MGQKHDVTHARIVREATRLFGERGSAEVRIEDVMGAAGLTRGGFYAHFKNKDALVLEAIATSIEAAKASLFGIPETEGVAWLARAATRYLAESHLDAGGAVSMVVALGADAVRHEGPARAALERGLHEIIAGMCVRLGQPLGGHVPGRAAALFASWIGALQLARITRDRVAAQCILAEALRASLCPQPVEPLPRR